MKPSDLTVTDMFCGAGGSSLGAEQAGVRLHMAMNHWKRAIETHQFNFPNAGHDCADISQSDPRRYPSTHVLIASPECTAHSLARSKKPRATLFDPLGADAAERSRATMMDVPRFAEFHQYDLVIVENVVEVVRWPGFVPWLQFMGNLGYEHEFVSLNSLVAHPTPQSRDRLYVVFWKRGNPTPNLRFEPLSWCPGCEAQVRGRQSFRRGGKRIGKYRQQYDYRCPVCVGIVYPYAYAAATAIDWGLPTQRIGDRVKALAPATRRRVEIGLERFGPAIVQAAGHTWEAPGSTYARTWPATDPIPAQTATLSHALALPAWMVLTARQNDERFRGQGLDEPMPAQTGQQEWALAFIAELRGGHSDARSVGDPLATVCASGMHHALVQPAFYVKNYGPASKAEAMPHSIREPLGTVTAVDHHSLVSLPFLTTYYGQSTVSPVSEPMPTATTHDRHGLIEPAVSVDDCGFRMLAPHEIQAAMAFPPDYVVTGTKREQVRQLGNAVTSPVMRMLVERCAETLS